MAKYLYPAIFTQEERGLYSVMFPDFEACFTQGSGVEDGMEMAGDVLALTLCDMEDDHKPIPQASNPLELQLEKNQFVSLVCADTTAYRKTYSGKAVKKTLTIPQWLNDAAVKEHVNFSQTLQNALLEQLHLQK